MKLTKEITINEYLDLISRLGDLGQDVLSESNNKYYLTITI